MTKKQRVHLMADLWPGACRAQGWDKNDRALRVRVLSDAAGRQLSSSSDLNGTDDFDRVKRHLLTLADNVRAASEEDHEGEARRTMHHVRELLAQLEELMAEPGAYVMELVRGIKKGRRVEIGGVEDLGTVPRMQCASCKPGGHGRGPGCPGFGQEHISELEQFRRTLNARINGKNGLASLHRATEPAPGVDLTLEEAPF